MTFIARAVPSLASVGILLLCSSCSTINVTHRAEFREGPEIRGTEHFRMNVDRFVREPSGENERVSIVPERIDRHFKIEHWRKKWDDVERERNLAVAGVHDDYSSVMDFFDSTLFAPIFPLLALYSVSANGADWVCIPSAFTSWLPFVCLVGPVTEVVQKNVDDRKVEPLDKVEMGRFAQLDCKRINWVVLDPDGSRRGRGRVYGSEPIELPWVKWILEQPDITSFRISVSSSDLDLVGNTNGILNVDLKDAIFRKWPNEGDRPMPSLTVRHELLDADATNSLDKLMTGQRAWVRIEVSSSTFSSPTYLLEPFVEGKSVSNVIETLPPAMQCLKRGSSTRFDIPIYVPLQFQEDELSFKVGIRDVFGRVFEASALNVAIKQTLLPDLTVHSAEISRDQADSSAWNLVVTVRNRGSGAAKNVVVTLLSCGADVHAVEKQGVVDKIEPFGRDQVVLKIKLGESPGLVIPTHLRLQENLGMPPVEAKVNVPIVQ